jgi:perosamine synthetase
VSATTAIDVKRIPFARTEVTLDARMAVDRVLASGWLTTGPEVAAFEEEFADWVGSKQAVAVSSCTAAIELALRALHLPLGSRILTSTMTFCGAVNAIMHAGLQPVLVDVNEETLMPDAATIRAAVAQGGPVQGMVAIHFGGYPAPIEELAEAAGLTLDQVIEDAAHAAGTQVGDRLVGAISAATCFSFYATKNLPIGEGGMVTTSDDSLAESVRRSRLHGMSRDAWRRYLPGSGWRYEIDVQGMKANMTDIQAAIGRAHLRQFPDWQRRREELAGAYDAALSAIAGIRTPARPERGRHAWHLYVIRVTPEFGMSRDELVAALSERGVDCSVHFIPLHHQPLYRRVLGEGIAGDFPVADSVFQEIVSLPFYPSLTEEQVDLVGGLIGGLRPLGRSLSVSPNGNGRRLNRSGRSKVAPPNGQRVDGVEGR